MFAPLSVQGPVNLPPEAVGLRQALRKMHSYMWLEDAIADDGGAQDAGIVSTPVSQTHCCVRWNLALAGSTLPTPVAH